MKKNILYIAFALTGLLFASCMGDSYADPNYSETPYGNNSITEDNVITISQLKSMYRVPISTTNGYRQVDSDLKIKGIVTSSDEQGNIYNELAIQDSTGAIIISVAQGGLYAFLPVGTEVLVDLKDLYVGNYGMQPEIGVPTTNSNLVTSLGRMSRATFDQHYKILSKGNTVEPEEFHASTWDLSADAGKLAIIRNVSFWRSGLDSTYADASGKQSVSWYFNELKDTVQVYNSGYADFANAVVPTYKVDVTGIMKRYRNNWELIIRTLDDVQPAATAIYEEGFTDGTGSWTANDVSLSDGLSYVWTGSSYGAKASAYVNSTNLASESWLISPAIDLSSVSEATLSITQCANYMGSAFGENCKIFVSTDYSAGAPSTATWTELTLDNLPTPDTKWTMVTGTTPLNDYAGKTIHLAFQYVSTISTAPTWEVRNVTIK